MSAPLVRRSPIHQAVVVATADVTPRMRRVTVRAEAMVGLVLKPAQDVELHLHEESGRRVKRRYTIRAARPDAGELDLDVLLHGDGPGSRWGASARPGDEIGFQGPRGKLELRPAPHHLLVGDESALPAIAAIAATLPPDEASTALIEVDGADDRQDVGARTVRWVLRDGAPAGGSELLAAEIGDIEVTPGAHAYLMGETRAMIALRAVLEGSRGRARRDLREGLLEPGPA